MSKPSSGAASTSDGLDRLGRPIVIGFRIGMIERAARMELSIDLALAIYHARSADTAYLLYSGMASAARRSDRSTRLGDG